MKYMFVSMLLGAGLMFYITSGHGKNVLATLPQVKLEYPSSPGASQALDVAEETEEPVAETMVQIHGKWYKHRSDNTYMIDGVPTLYIAKKNEIHTVHGQTASPNQAAKPKGPTNLEKSQKLVKMAGENPLSVYTPEGFQALKDGLDAATNSANERKKALEELSREQ